MMWGHTALDQDAWKDFHRPAFIRAVRKENLAWPHKFCLRYQTKNPDLLIIGDSIFDGWSGYLLKVFPKAIVDAKVGRQFSQGVVDYQKLLQYPGIRDIRTIVIELGTNGPVTKSQVIRLMNLAGPNRHVVWITPFVPRPWQNEVLATCNWAKEMYPKNLFLVHWHRAAERQSDWFFPDGVHPNSTGISYEISMLYKKLWS